MLTIAALTIGGLTAQQLVIIAVAALVALAVGAWRLWPTIAEWRREKEMPTGYTIHRPQTVQFDEPLQPVILGASSDSDRKSPQGTREWISEILAAVDGAPDSLKLQLLLDSTTTVASAQRRYIEHLQKPAVPVPAPAADSTPKST